MDVRTRLVRYLEARAPDKLDSVDAALERYAGREEEMFATLVNRYGPEPSATTTEHEPAATSTTPEKDYRARLVRFYQHYAPEKLSNVDNALERFKGAEETMFATLVVKYGPEPTPPQPSTAQTTVPTGVDDAPAGDTDAATAWANLGPSSASAEGPTTNQSIAAAMRARLVRFYEHYAPEKLSNVDTALERFAGDEETMFATLVVKYGPEPPFPAPTSQRGTLRSTAVAAAETISVKESRSTAASTPDVATLAAPAAAAAVGNDRSSAARERLVRFYEHYAPEKLSNVDAALARYAGQEELMFSTLVSRYGPEPEPAKTSTPSPAATPVVTRPRSNTSTTVDAPPATPSEGAVMRARLIRFYLRYAPEKVTNVDITLATYAGREDQLFATLVAKYGPEEGSVRQRRDGDTASATSLEEPAALVVAHESPHRERLVTFFQTYAPERVSTVDAVLARYEGDEEVMFELLQKKYCPTAPSSQSPTPSSTSSAVAAAAASHDVPIDPVYRAQLEAVYREHDPARLPHVAEVLAQYRGNEADLFAILQARYMPTATAPQSPLPQIGDGEEVVAATTTTMAPASAEAVFANWGGDAAVEAINDEDEAASSHSPSTDARERLVRFYEHYAPEKLSNVDAALTRYAGQEELMFSTLVSRYGPEPNPAVVPDPEAPTPVANEPAATSATAAAVGQRPKVAPREAPPAPVAAAPSTDETDAAARTSAARERLVRFYEHYAPEKLSNVDAALARYAGQEELMFSTLVSRYGPEPEPGQDTPSDDDDDDGHKGSDEEVEPYRDRLIRFYMHYAPEKVAQVDATLLRYAGREEGLFASLVAKYGPEPIEDGGSSSSSSADDAEDHDDDYSPAPRQPQAPAAVHIRVADVAFLHRDAAAPPAVAAPPPQVVATVRHTDERQLNAARIDAEWAAFVAAAKTQAEQDEPPRFVARGAEGAVVSRHRRHDVSQALQIKEEPPTTRSQRLIQLSPPRTPPPPPPKAILSREERAAVRLQALVRGVLARAATQRWLERRLCAAAESRCDARCRREREAFAVTLSRFDRAEAKLRSVRAAQIVALEAEAKRRDISQRRDAVLQRRHDDSVAVLEAKAAACVRAINTASRSALMQAATASSPSSIRRQSVTASLVPTPRQTTAAAPPLRRSPPRKHLVAAAYAGDNENDHSPASLAARGPQLTPSRGAAVRLGDVAKETVTCIVKPEQQQWHAAHLQRSMQRWRREGLHL